ncbi:MAG TPA: CpaD family pilus assembly protein [Caulobacteraceae bacterium]
MKTTAIVLLLAGIALGACASEAGLRDSDAVTPTEHFAIEVQSQPETLQLAAHHGGATRRQADALGAFAQQWTDMGGGEIRIQVPTRGADPASAYRTATDARDILLARGIPPGKLRMVSYTAFGGHPATVVVTYPRYRAKGPDCGQGWGNLSATADNRAFDNFGCAVTADIAAQIANPADLLSPRDLDPPDGARRQQVLDHYRKGEATSSAKDEQANGAVSTAVH